MNQSLNRFQYTVSKRPDAAVAKTTHHHLRTTLQRIATEAARVPPGDRHASIKALAYIREAARLALALDGEDEP